MLAFSFLWVFYAGFHYRRKYLTSLDHDNLYVTSYFLKYDCKKLHKHQNYLLPLTKRETGRYVELRSLKLSTFEIGLTGIGLILVTVHLIYSIIVFFVDYFFYQILFSFATITGSFTAEGTLFEDWKELIIQDAITIIRISTQANVDSYESVEDFALQVFAHIDTELNSKQGIMSDLFNQVKNSVKKLAIDPAFELNPHLCVPQAQQPDYSVYIIIAVLYFFVYLVCFFQAYILRLRRNIMSFFHPVQERARVRYLHAKIWQERETFFHSDIVYLRNQQLEPKKKSNPGVLEKLLKKIKGDPPFVCGICKVKGKDKDSRKFKTCTNTSCGAVYCNQCYHQMNEICIKCLAGSENYDPTKLIAAVKDEEFSAFSDSSDDDSFTELRVRRLQLKAKRNNLYNRNKSR